MALSFIDLIHNSQLYTRALAFVKSTNDRESNQRLALIPQSHLNFNDTKSNAKLKSQWNYLQVNLNDNLVK